MIWQATGSLRMLWATGGMVALLSLPLVALGMRIGKTADGQSTQRGSHASSYPTIIFSVLMSSPPLVALAHAET